MSKDIHFNKIDYIIIGVIVVLFILSRFSFHNYVSDITGYDSACYYMDAKHLINGYTPYKDYILVHPIPFILFLAIFIKLFNLSFIDTFYIIYLLNFVGLVYMYKIGKLIYGKYFGYFLSFLYTIDPIIWTFGKNIAFESMIIPLIIIQIYYLLCYFKYNFIKYLLYSSFILGILLSIKMTIFQMFFGFLLFLVSILLFKRISGYDNFLCFFINNLYILNIKKIFIKSLMIYLIILIYLEIIGFINADNVFIPFITFVDVIHYNNYISMILFVIIFILYTLIRLNNNSVIFRKLKYIKNIKNSHLIKKIIICLVLCILPKLVEFIMGVYIGGYNYIEQCYLIQMSRSAMLILSVFNIVSIIIIGILTVNWKIIHGWLLLILLLLFFSFLLNSKMLKINYYLSAILLLFIFLFVGYAIFPNLPSIRYMLPLYIIFVIFLSGVLYKYLLEPIINIKKIIIITIILSLLITNFIICYIEGEHVGFYYESWRSPFTENTIPLYNNVHEYIQYSKLSNKKYWATSPVILAYLNLNSTVKYIDVYAMEYLYNDSKFKYIELLKSEGVDYALITPWAWNFNLQNKPLCNNLMKGYVLQYETGDGVYDITMYDLNKKNNFPYYFYIQKSDIYIFDNNSIISKINTNMFNYTLKCINYSNDSIKYILTNNNENTDKNKLIILNNSGVYILPQP